MSELLTVHVTYIDLRSVPWGGFEVLSADERARIDRFLDSVAATRWARARIALRWLLSARTGIDAPDIRYRLGPFGKPVLDCADGPAPAAFSMSHSGDWACVVITKGPALGVDIECERPMSDLGELARAALTPEERSLWAALPATAKASSFLRSWTRKEAVLKACGFGLHDRLPMQGLDVTDDRVVAPAGDTMQDPWIWHLRDLPAPAGLHAALATMRPVLVWSSVAAQPAVPAGVGAK